jgi:hypothetical protein
MNTSSGQVNLKMTLTFLPLSTALFTGLPEFSLEFEIHHILAKEGVCRHGLI